MNKEQAFQIWWDKQKGRLPETFQFMYRQGFEAGYEASRAEEDEAVQVIRSAADFYANKTNIHNLIQKYLESKTDEGLANRLRVLNEFVEWVENAPRSETNISQETGNWIEGHTNRFANIGHRHRDNQDGTGLCLDCGQNHYHTDPPLPYEHTP